MTWYERVVFAWGALVAYGTLTIVTFVAVREFALAIERFLLP